MFTPGFSNACPYCQGPIVLEVDREPPTKPVNVRMVAFLEFLAHIRMQLKTSKTDLYKLMEKIEFPVRESASAPAWNDRGRMLFEEYIEALCNTPTAFQDAPVR